MKYLMTIIFILAFVACSKSHSSSPVAAITNIAIPTAEAASMPDCTPSEGQSVIWVKDTGKLMFCSPDSKWVEISVSATIIDAKNVKLGSAKLGLTDAPVKTAGYLSATNLQDALGVVAMDLSTNLPGSSWTVVNKSKPVTGLEFFAGETGAVSFTKDGHIEVSEGRVAALGIMDSHCAGYVDANDSYEYEVISGNVIMMSSHVEHSGNVNEAQSLIKVTAQDQDTLMIMGHGVCGSTDDQISILHRVK